MHQRFLDDWWLEPEAMSNLIVLEGFSAKVWAVNKKNIIIMIIVVKKVIL